MTFRCVSGNPGSGSAGSGMLQSQPGDPSLPSSSCLVAASAAKISAHCVQIRRRPVVSHRSAPGHTHPPQRSQGAATAASLHRGCSHSSSANGHRFPSSQASTATAWPKSGKEAVTGAKRRSLADLLPSAVSSFVLLCHALFVAERAGAGICRLCCQAASPDSAECTSRREAPGLARRAIVGREARVLKRTPPCSLYVADRVMRPVSAGGATLVPN
jgi:hypothetical protein